MGHADSTPEVWLARTVRALESLDADELERLSAEVEAAARTVPPEIALESVRRAARLQQTLTGLLQATEESLRVLHRAGSRGGDAWEH